MLNCIKSYLSNRSYQAQIDGVLSEEAPCLSGVPFRRLFGSCREILEQIAGTPSVVTLDVDLQKQLDRQWSEIFPAAPVQILFPFIDIFLYIATPDYVYVSLNSKY